MIIPRVGQTWSFRLRSGHRVTRKIRRIYWQESDKRPGRKVALLSWSHTPKARYLPDWGIRVLFHERSQARLLTTRAADVGERCPFSEHSFYDDGLGVYRCVCCNTPRR